MQKTLEKVLKESNMSKKILLSGGTGFVGRVIVRKLISQGHQVFILTRDVKRCLKTFDSKVVAIEWKSYNDSFDTKELNDLDVVINLVGESLTAKRWTDNQKKEIYNSRIVATETIIKELKKSNIHLSNFISTSAIGIYSSGFLKNVCEKWEKAALTAESIADTVSIVRVSVVLGASGGMIKELYPVFKLGLGGTLGSGKQMISWIHVDDLANVYIECIFNAELATTLNAVSRFNVSNKEFTTIFSKLLNKPAKLTVPKFALTLLKGEVAQMIFDDQDVKAVKLNETKFKYNFPTMELALKNITSNL